MVMAEHSAGLEEEYFHFENRTFLLNRSFFNCILQQLGKVNSATSPIKQASSHILVHSGYLYWYCLFWCINRHVLERY